MIIYKNVIRSYLVFDYYNKERKLLFMKTMLKEILANIAEIEEDEIRDEATLEDLGIDSLMFIDFCVQVERKCKIKLEVAKLVAFGTVSEIMKYIEECKDKSGEICIEVF